jgi:hypothetical protein
MPKDYSSIEIRHYKDHCVHGHEFTPENSRIDSRGSRLCKICTLRRSRNNTARRPLYMVWASMKSRCQRKNNLDYHYYGGRGIKVCERWQKYENFAEDMSPRPSPKHTLDRIDNDGNYEPGNCRWATPKEQHRNTRRNIFFVVDGVKTSATELCERHGINQWTLYSRIKRGFPQDKLFLPPRKRTYSTQALNNKFNKEAEG